MSIHDDSEEVGGGDDFWRSLYYRSSNVDKIREIINLHDFPLKDAWNIEEQIIYQRANTKEEYLCRTERVLNFIRFRFSMPNKDKNNENTSNRAEQKPHSSTMGMPQQDTAQQINQPNFDQSMKPYTTQNYGLEHANKPSTSRTMSGSTISADASAMSTSSPRPSSKMYDQKTPHQMVVVGSTPVEMKRTSDGSTSSRVSNAPSDYQTPNEMLAVESRPAGRKRNRSEGEMSSERTISIPDDDFQMVIGSLPTGTSSGISWDWMSVADTTSYSSEDVSTRYDQPNDPFEQDQSAVPTTSQTAEILLDDSGFSEFLSSFDESMDTKNQTEPTHQVGEPSQEPMQQSILKNYLMNHQDQTSPTDPTTDTTSTSMNEAEDVAMSLQMSDIIYIDEDPWLKALCDEIDAAFVNTATDDDNPFMQDESDYTIPNMILTDDEIAFFEREIRDVGQPPPSTSVVFASSSNSDLNAMDSEQREQAIKEKLSQLRECIEPLKKVTFPGKEDPGLMRELAEVLSCLGRPTLATAMDILRGYEFLVKKYGLDEPTKEGDPDSTAE